MIDTLRHDLKYAVRALRHTRGFTVAAALTLVLGLGATSAIFTVVNAALLQALPYPRHDRLVALAAADGGPQSGQIFLYVRDRARHFDHVVAQRPTNGWNVVAGDLVAYVPAMQVSDGYFEALGVRPLLGRGFTRSEASPDGPNAVVISESLWRRAYAARPDAIGETVKLGGVSHTLAGVMPDGFRTIPDADVWTPLRTTLADNGINYRVVGRLQDGVPLAQAVAEFATLRDDIQREFPRANVRRLASTTWVPLRNVLGANVRQPLLILLGAGAFLLLIACVNVANLLLTRALARRREFATQAALGATRLSAARQVVVECVLLALGGAVGAVALAGVLTRLLMRLISPETARLMLSGATPQVDWFVFGITVLVATACALIFGLAPSLSATRVDLRTTLAASTATTAGRRTVWLRRTFAAIQVTLAVLLLVGAGLLIRTLSNLVGTELGFNPAGVVVGRMSLQGAADDDVRLTSLLDRGLARLREVPGVTAAAASTSVPIERPLNLPVEPPARSLVTDVRAVDWRYVTPGFFDLLGIPRVDGRVFDERDRAGTQPVAIVNTAFARAYFGTATAVGEQIRLAAFRDPERTIVGVVGDVKSRTGTDWVEGLTARSHEAAPMIFVPATQVPPSLARSAHATFPITWIVKANAPSPELERQLRDAMRGVDPQLAFIAFEPMEAVIARDLDMPRFIMTLVAAFACLAIALAAIGLYGLMAYSASQRTREVGIRMALGATAARILAALVAEGAWVTAVGLAVGTAAAALSTRALAGLLFGVTALDATTFFTAGVFFVIIGAIATAIPAARAARMNPVRALRTE